MEGLVLGGEPLKSDYAHVGVDKITYEHIMNSRKQFWTLTPYMESSTENIVWRYMVIPISCPFQNIIQISLSHFFKYPTIFIHELLVYLCLSWTCESLISLWISYGLTYSSMIWCILCIFLCISSIKEWFYVYSTDFFMSFTLMSHFLQFMRTSYQIRNIAFIMRSLYRNLKYHMDPKEISLRDDGLKVWSQRPKLCRI